jgi:YD repeat-containing protein
MSIPAGTITTDAQGEATKTFTSYDARFRFAFVSDVGGSHYRDYAINWVDGTVYPFEPNPDDAPVTASSGGLPGSDDATANSTSVMTPQIEPGISADPIRYGNGEIQLYVDDLVSRGFTTWGQRRSYSNLHQPKNAPLGQGGWYANFQPYLSQAPSHLVVWMSATQSYAFSPSGTAFIPLRFNVERLSMNNGDYVFNDAQGNSATFYSFDAAVAQALRGRLKRFDDPQGNQTLMTYDGNGRLQNARRTVTVNGTVTAEAFVYTYNTDGRVGNVKWQVTVGAGTNTVRQADYEYYTGVAGDFGEAGTLRRVTIKEHARPLLLPLLPLRRGRWLHSCFEIRGRPAFLCAGRAGLGRSRDGDQCQFGNLRR